MWLFMLSLWCLAVALVQHIPLEMALLGWSSYVFFVPLLYVGAELAADDRLVAKALKVVAICGGIVGAGVIASALLGQSAPTLLQPIIPAVGIHSSSMGNIYLAPSIFATGEEAAEQLLIALFAWAALAHLTNGRLRGVLSALLGVLIAFGLIATARRADIYVAIIGIIAMLIQGIFWAATQPASSRAGSRLRHAAVSGLLSFSLQQDPSSSSFSSGKPIWRRSWLPALPEVGFHSMFSLPNLASPLGQGPGTSTQGITALGETPLAIPQGGYLSYVLDGRTLITAEGGLARTWLELGIIGVVLYRAVFGWRSLPLSDLCVG